MASKTSFALVRFLAILLSLAYTLSAHSQEEELLEPIEVKAAEAEPADESDEDEASETSSESAAADEKKEAESKEDPLDSELKELRRQRDLLSTRNALRAEKVEAELAEMREEKERLSLENALFTERVRAELIEQRGELDRVSAEIDAINKQMSLDTARMRQELQTQLAELRRREEVLSLENVVMQKETGIEMERLKLAETKLKLRRTELETEFAELQAKLAIKEKEEELDDRVVMADESNYLADPYVNGVLRISDRRIALNGPIWTGLASHVSERINYFNNQSTEHPIFIVIDSSPGGSVWAGYRILKSMEGSKAPVFVVVKSYAASMAAIIATLAERSYAYPNAMILHHELSWYGVVGNLSQQSEYADDAKEWWRRLAEPVAEKMGVTLQEFRALMYEKSSTGDWQEFADVAQQYGWIGQVVDKIWETSIVKNPDRYGTQFWANAEKEVNRDENGRAYVELPRLEPFDFYFIYNPDGYYRIPK